jgi:hypothetical protein
MYLSRLPDFAVARHREMLAAAQHARRARQARGGRPHPRPRGPRLSSAALTEPRLHAGRVGAAATR